MPNSPGRDRTAGAQAVEKFSWSADFQSAKSYKLDELHAGKDARAPTRKAASWNFSTASASMPAELLDQMETHALSESGEVCGLVYEHHYLRLRNISLFPNRSFYADPAELAHGLFFYGEPLAIFHTHPNCSLELSTEDKKLWYYHDSTMIVGCIDDGRLRWKMYGNRGD